MNLQSLWFHSHKEQSLVFFSDGMPSGPILYYDYGLITSLLKTFQINYNSF